MSESLRKRTMTLLVCWLVMQVGSILAQSSTRPTPSAGGSMAPTTMPAGATTMAPGMSTMAPGMSTMAPGMSTMAPGGSTMAPGGSTMPPGTSTMPSGGSEPSGEGTTSSSSNDGAKAAAIVLGIIAGVLGIILLCLLCWMWSTRRCCAEGAFIESQRDYRHEVYQSAPQPASPGCGCQSNYRPTTSCGCQSQPYPVRYSSYNQPSRFY